MLLLTVVFYSNFPIQAKEENMVQQDPVFLLGDANLDGVMLADDYASVQANFANGGQGKAAEPQSSVGVQLSTVIPVVHRDLVLRVDGGKAFSDPGEAILTIKDDEGKTVYERQVRSSKPGQFKAIWKPLETGFYTATFSFGTEGKTKKLNRRFAVVWRDLYFVTWGMLQPHDFDKVNYLSSHIILGGKLEKYKSYWQNRGSKVIRCVSGGQKMPHGRIDDITIDRWVKIFSKPIEDGFDGIFIDEFGEYPSENLLEKVRSINRILREWRKKNPDAILMPAAAGALLREKAEGYRAAGAVALLETYPSCFTLWFGSHSILKHIDRRVEKARNTDVLFQRGRKFGNSIILLGTHVDSVLEEPLQPQLERWVRYIKKTAPEMPGIGFYGGRYDGLLEKEEQWCLDYYVKPVVDVRSVCFSNYNPVAGKPLEVFVTVHNLGGMDAKRVPLKIYALEVGGDPFPVN